MPAWLDKAIGAVWSASMKGLARGPHVTRFAMYERLGEVGRALPKRSGRVLSISRSTNLIGVVGVESSEVVEADYPEHDLLALDFGDAEFDFVLADQVLEHVAGSPQRAVDECFRVLRPGGILVLTTCFINPIHDEPDDYWRFTPHALRLLARGASAILDCDGWGNFDVWRVVRYGLRFEGVPRASWHPLHAVAVQNDPEWPIVTWLVARK
jgi:SAM-dependent methyltransferase